jgi:hypothetical protein
MRLIVPLFLTVIMIASVAPAAMGTAALTETTLEKISLTGVLVIGTRTSSLPFAYINRSNEWVGFAIDLVEQGVLPAAFEKVLPRVAVVDVVSAEAELYRALLERFREEKIGVAPPLPAFRLLSTEEKSWSS